LVTFVVGHARDLSSNQFPGPEMANRIEGVLRGSDPEPATPFCGGGGGPAGLEALLHGPVQMWDAAQWCDFASGTGWMRHTFAGDGPVVAGPAGSNAPQLMVDSPIDLTTGVVPELGCIAPRGRTGPFATWPGRARQPPNRRLFSPWLPPKRLAVAAAPASQHDGCGRDQSGDRCHHQRRSRMGGERSRRLGLGHAGRRPQRGACGWPPSSVPPPSGLGGGPGSPPLAWSPAPGPAGDRRTGNLV